MDSKNTPLESPESSVWPGEEEIKSVADTESRKWFPDIWNNTSYKAGFEKAAQWLQSRTAVKEESTSMSAGAYAGDPLEFKNGAYQKRGMIDKDNPEKGDNGTGYKNWYVGKLELEIQSLKEEINQFKQSQPTAGGVKEEVKPLSGEDIIIPDNIRLEALIIETGERLPVHRLDWTFTDNWDCSINGIRVWEGGQDIYYYNGQFKLYNITNKSTNQSQPTAGGSETHCDQTEIDLWQRIFDRCKETYPIKEATERYIEILGILRGKPDQPSPLKSIKE